MEISEVREFLKNIKKWEIIFDRHFYKRSAERPINEGMLLNFIFQPNRLEEIEKGNKENRFKLWFKMSSKYSLVLIVEIDTTKVLKIISAWNSDKKWQRQLKQ